MNINTSIEPNKEAGEHINSLLSKNSNAPVLFMVSGGSAMDVLEYVDVNLFNKNISITLVDERRNVVEKDSNAWKLVQSDWFKKVKKNSVQLVVLSDVSLKNWKKENKNGKIIALLGMGADGHTAGVLPMPKDEEKFNKLFINTEDWVVKYTNKTTDNVFKDRTTITLHFLKEIIDNIVVYEIGVDKAKRIQNLNKKYAPHIEPADILLKIRHVDILTDM